MSTFLFANIATSGIKVMTSEGVNRRARFILTVSGAFGLGTIIVPEWFTSAGFLDCPSIESAGLRGLCDAAVTTLSTGYAIGCLVALILNGILPGDDEGDGAEEEVIPLKHDSTLEMSKHIADGSDEGVMYSSGEGVMDSSAGDEEARREEKFLSKKDVRSFACYIEILTKQILYISRLLCMMLLPFEI